MNSHLMTTPVVASNNTSTLSACFHSDNAFKYQAYIYTFLLLFPVAFICNILALVVFFLQRRSSSPSCIVMTNLALSDSSFSLTLPLRLAYYFRGGVWDFPDWLCRLCVYGFYVNLYTSILFLTLLSALRRLAVAHPLRHRSLATPTRVSAVCVGIWLFVGGASAPFLSHGVTNRAGSPRCFEPSSRSSWGRVLIMNYLALALGFLLPFLTIIVSYSSLIRHLAGSSHFVRGGPSARSRRVDLRLSVHLVTMVIVTFLLCFLPYHVSRSLHLHAVYGGWDCDVTVALQRAVAVTLCLAASNSVVNPVLYYYSTRSFRTNMNRLTLRGRSLRTAMLLRRRNNSRDVPEPLRLRIINGEGDLTI